jgi:uncharacterized protein
VLKDRECEYESWTLVTSSAVLRNDLLKSRPLPARAGIGLRPLHHSWVTEQRPGAAWFEVHAENFISHALLQRELDIIAADYALSLHCVGLSLGSVELPEGSHLQSLRDLLARYQPRLVSDHLTWSAINGIHLPDLLPLPYTEEALQVVVRNVLHVQEILQRAILLENPSQYVALADSTLTEAEFLAEVVARTGCGVLLDINNLYVSAHNHGLDAEPTLSDFLSVVPAESIQELHLAGHGVLNTQGEQLLVDDHGSRVCQNVWDLYAATVRVVGRLPTLIEWDMRIPKFGVLEEEAAAADRIMLGADDSFENVDAA